MLNEENLTPEQLEEKLCPKAGVEVVAGTVSKGHMFVFVEAKPIPGSQCDRIARFILGPTRESVLAEHKKLEPVVESEEIALSATCFVGEGPVVLLSDRGGVQTLPAQSLFVSDIGTLTVKGATVTPPTRVVFADSSAHFSAQDIANRANRIASCGA